MSGFIHVLPVMGIVVVICPGLMCQPEEVSGNGRSHFFAQYIEGTDELPFREELHSIGAECYVQPFSGEGYISVVSSGKGYQDFLIR